LLGLAGSMATLVAMARGRASGVSYDPGNANAKTGVLTRPARQNGLIAGLTITLLVVVIGFYIINTGNYGGWTAGPRWLMWLTPFLLLSMRPALDWLAPRRWGRIVAYLLLAISAISASYPAWNPWRHPWLYNWMEKLDWIRY
jgi:hypothetical protein